MLTLAVAVARTLVGHLAGTGEGVATTAIDAVMKANGPNMTHPITQCGAYG